ncbi:hypothetical protein ABW19_dt0203883 [Dactylella cylindrospora]|nr:hypothetical protein ABW19_dt0203883 [Dactylella cylindrospora]
MRSNRQLTIVIKLGTSSICDEKTHEPLISNLSLIVETVVKLRRDGHRVILVSSGAIGIGLRKLDLPKRPKQLAKLQAIAAIGQCELLALWDKLFSQLRQPVAQVLLTRNDIVDRTQYLNAANTFAELLNMNVVPIVNENDTLAVSEIKFGDNDTLSGITAGMVNADYLFLMTDVDCLYDKNPRSHPDAMPIMVVDDVASLQADVSTPGSAVGTGGMATKLVAAKLATSAGVTTIITRSNVPGNILEIVRYCQTLKTASQPQTPRPGSPHLSATTIHTPPTEIPPELHADAAGEYGPAVIAPTPISLLSASSSTDTSRAATPSTTAISFATGSTVSFATPTVSSRPVSPHPPPSVPLHTRFLPRVKAVRDRRFWILYGLKPHGTVYIDEGAYNALTRSSGGASLLPVGVVDVTGEFHQLEAISFTVVKRGVAEGTEGVPAGKNYKIIAQDVGRALVNYSSAEIAKIKGIRSSDIMKVLDYADTEYISHRDNTAFFPTYEKGKGQSEI